MMTRRKRILSGIRPTGRLHLGNLHGALENWIQLQEQFDGFFFVADWHALSTSYANPEHIREYTREMVFDWLAVGLDPRKCTIFIQSDVKEHAELHLLLGMITPVPWLERNPTFKDQQVQMSDRDLSTYGFLGYPVLQAADIIMYKANGVPVGKDQLPHVELTREIARRFNFIFQREVFPIPDALLTETPVVPGTDGRKMSKSYGNHINITESEESLRQKISMMVTDPRRVRRSDPGDPEVSTVFALHKIYSSPAEVADLAEGCRTARIGCVECKKILFGNVWERLRPIREKRIELDARPEYVTEVLVEGVEKARAQARITMEEVRSAVGLSGGMR